MRKRIATIILAICCFAVFTGMNVSNNKEAKDKQRLKILCIGNSFNQDVMAYVPCILNELLPDAEITYGILYAGSAGLNDHIKWWNKDKPYTVFNYWKPDSKAWTRMSFETSKTLKQVLAMEDWDVITIQGVTGDIKNDSTIDEMIVQAKKLASILRDNAKESFSLVWFQWMARPVQSMTTWDVYDRINQATLKIMSDSEMGMSDVIPIGTAIQTARALPFLRDVSGYELLFTDMIHMQAGFPALLSAYTVAVKILEWLGKDPSDLIYSSWTPTSWNTVAINAADEMGSGMTHGEVEGITDKNIEFAKRIAIASVNSPLSIPNFSGSNWKIKPDRMEK